MHDEFKKAKKKTLDVVARSGRACAGITEVLYALCDVHNLSATAQKMKIGGHGGKGVYKDIEEIKNLMVSVLAECKQKDENAMSNNEYEHLLRWADSSDGSKKGYKDEVVHPMPPVYPAVEEYCRFMHSDSTIRKTVSTAFMSAMEYRKCKDHGKDNINHWDGVKTFENSKNTRLYNNDDVAETIAKPMKNTKGDPRELSYEHNHYAGMTIAPKFPGKTQAEKYKHQMLYMSSEGSSFEEALRLQRSKLSEEEWINSPMTVVISVNDSDKGCVGARGFCKENIPKREGEREIGYWGDTENDCWDAYSQKEVNANNLAEKEKGQLSGEPSQQATRAGVFKEVTSYFIHTLARILSDLAPNIANGTVQFIAPGTRMQEEYYGIKPWHEAFRIMAMQAGATVYDYNQITRDCALDSGQHFKAEGGVVAQRFANLLIAKDIINNGVQWLQSIQGPIDIVKISPETGLFTIYRNKKLYEDIGEQDYGVDEEMEEASESAAEEQGKPSGKPVPMLVDSEIKEEIASPITPAQPQPGASDMSAVDAAKAEESSRDMAKMQAKQKADVRDDWKKRMAEKVSGPQTDQEFKENVQEAIPFIHTQLSANHNINVHGRPPTKGSVWINVSTQVLYRYKDDEEDKDLPIQPLETIGPILGLKIAVSSKKKGNKISIMAMDKRLGYETWVVLTHDWYYTFKEFKPANPLFDIDKQDEFKEEQYMSYVLTDARIKLLNGTGPPAASTVPEKITEKQEKINKLNKHWKRHFEVLVINTINGIDEGLNSLAVFLKERLLKENPIGNETRENIIARSPKQITWYFELLPMNLKGKEKALWQIYEDIAVDLALRQWIHEGVNESGTQLLAICNEPEEVVKGIEANVRKLNVPTGKSWADQMDEEELLDDDALSEHSGYRATQPQSNLSPTPGTPTSDAEGHFAS